MLKKDLILFFLLISLIVQSQNRYNVDSLNRVLETTSNDTVKIKTLQWIFDNYFYTKPDSAKISYEEMMNISERNGFDFGFYNAYLYKATYYWTISKMDSVITAMNFALDYALKMEDDAMISNCYVRLAMVQSNLGNYSESKNLTYKALKIAEKKNDWEGLYYAYYKLGNLYYLENDFDLALINYLKVDSIFEHHDYKEPALAGSLHSIGSIYMEYKNFSKAEEYFIRSRDVYKEMDRQQGEFLIDVKMGQLEFNKENYNKAIEMLKPPLEYYSVAGDKVEMSNISLLIASAYLAVKNITEAEKYYKESLRLAIETKNKFSEAQSYVGLADIARNYNNPNSTILYLSKAWQLYKEMNVSYKKPQVLKNLANAHTDKKDYKIALNYYQEYQTLMDSLSEKENIENFQELETKYQTEKKEQEISLLKSQNELVEEQKKNQRNLLLGGIGLTSLAGLFFFFLYRNRQKTTKKLQELDTAKSNFFANISHEFRTPLTLISGPLQKQLKRKNLANEERNNLEMMHRNSTRLLSLVDQLLDLSKIEAGSLKLNVAMQELMPFLGTLSDGFTYPAKQKEINYRVNIQTTVDSTFFDKDVIEKIVVNLISNAIKYTPAKGSIECKAFIKEHQLHFDVKNTGKGLSEEELTKVFDRFYQIDENKEGVGIGLALVKELVELHKGAISVVSEPNNWTIFNVTLPINKESFKESEMKVSRAVEKKYQPDSNTDLQTQKQQDAGIDDFNNEDVPILLIVDDNEDVRNYVGNLFKNAYTILTGKNGEEGIDMAIEKVPDIIISDIMMPIKNGIDLCNALKVDERTSHIPIILLTAKAGEENEIEGIKTGADDYVTKPFHEDLLLLRVEKLIESRKKLQQRYSQEVILRPKDIAITPIDEQFLERMQKVMDVKLVESSFSIEDFSKAVGMSRMQLHRKLKALTGLSASEFIRSQRLKLAAQLLKKSEINVSQVGYSVGFNDHAYFSKCFREMYHTTPSAYAKSAKKQS